MMKRRFLVSRGKVVLIASVVLILLALGGGRVRAQTTGTIYGTITDPAGASIHEATVSATNLQTNLTRTTKTAADGSYSFARLPVGRYTVSVEIQGFKTSQQVVDLDVESNLRVDFRLEVGAIAEQVSITGEAPQVDTVSTTLGKVVEERRIVDLPLNGRNFLQLGVLQAGVTPPPAGIIITGNGANEIPGGPSVNFSVNGMRVTSNNHLLDGVNNVEPLSGAAMIVPSPDTLQEFRILTNAYSAEYGRSGASVVTVLTKTGSNRLHGSVYEFLRNDALDARNFFTPQVPALKQNQFGFSVGGPILKDRTFFFGGYEGFRQRRGFPSRTTVPSLRVRRGDFTEEPIKPIDPVTMQRFPGDIIPPERIDPVTRRLLPLWPEPNIGSNVWAGAPTGSNDRDQFIARVDHAFRGGKNNLTGRYLFDAGTLIRPVGSNVGGSTNPIVEIPGLDSQDTNRFQNLLVADTHVFSARLINEFRFSYQRARVIGGIPIETRKPSDLGFTFPVTSSFSSYPSISLPGIGSIGYDNIVRRVYNFFQVAENFVVSSGKHNLKFGADVRHTRLGSIFPSRAFGAFNFNNPGVVASPLGALLLGRPSFFLQAGGKEDKTLKQTVYYFYGQDEIRLSRKVTLNLGLRYELVPGFTERDNAQVTFRAGQKSTVGPTLPVGLLRPGDADVPRTLFPIDKNNFAPRLGIAWDPLGDGKTSIRASYGLFYDESALVQSFHVQQPPDLQPLLTTFPPLLASFADPWGGNSPFRPPLQFPFNVTGRVTAVWIDADLKLAYIQHWNLTVQRQLTSSLAIEVAYVGNKGTKLQGNIDINQPVWMPGATTANANNRRPFAGLSSAFQVSSAFNSNYHGLQVTATQRLSRGLSFQASYTWSKAIDDTSLPTSFFTIPGQPRRAQDSRNLRAERGLSGFDLRHRFVLSHIYEFPFFQKYGGVVTFLLGGWRLSGILSLQSGYPFTVVDSANPSLDNTSTAGDRPDLLRNPNLPSSQRTPDRWFDTGAFRRFVAPNWGTAGRNIVFTDGISNYDMGLSKAFKVTEDKQFEFRWEVFNLFNHPNFGAPVNDFNSPTFGRVFSTSTRERLMQFALKFLF